MPTYNYYCINCDEYKEITHSMSECDQPSEATIAQCTCYCGRKMKRQLSIPSLLTFGRGTYDKGGLKSKDERQQAFSKRSKQDSIKNGVQEKSKEMDKKIREQFKK